MKILGTLLLSYEEMLERIENCNNHLLLGNGFNRGLGVNTSYSSIFQKMLEANKSVYKDIEHLVEECMYDLELLIGRLQEDIRNDNVFLKKYINNKIKLDFMQATHEIVKAEIKKVYAEKNEGIFILLKEFSNYFTLNYDSFLYLLLLNYKISEKNNVAIAMQPTLGFVQEDMNFNNNEIYDEVLKIRNGSLTISVENNELNPTNKPIQKVTKTTFTSLIKEYAKTTRKNWKGIDIERVVNHILEEEKKNHIIEKVDDGAQLVLFKNEREFIFDTDSATQNLFFLHGAFHIYKDGKSIKKITQQSDQALYDRLEKILNNDEQEVVCIFQTENKLEAIKENDYLTNCYDKLAELSGNLVILGCSLSENDMHIFDNINQSEIENIYISTTKYNEEIVANAKSIFPDKKIDFIDVATISYELPEEN